MQDKDRVTVSLYSTKISATPGYHRGAFDQIANIKAMKENLSSSARLAGNRPPEFVISMLLIPDAGNYNAPSYAVTKNAMLLKMRQDLNAAGLEDVVLEDFIDTELSNEERGYLDGLTAKGSCADMIKTHAIIAERNRNRRHLQIDTNTQIYDYDDFYNMTFGAADNHDKIAGGTLNASYYDEHYVSAHNKVVYTTPNSPLAGELRRVHLRYCDEHKDDPANSEEKKDKNSIYSKDFVVALHHLGLTEQTVLPASEGETRTIYPAAMSRPEYGLTKTVITSVKKSWSGKQEDKPAAERGLESLNVPIGDTQCDFASFEIAVKKHVGNLYEHNFSQAPASDSTAIVRLEQDAHEALLRISNPDIDKAVITGFYDAVMDGKVRDTHFGATKEDMLNVLARYFPNTKRGNALSLELFGCSASELRANPVRYSLGYHQTLHLSHIQEKQRDLENMEKKIDQKLTKAIVPTESYYLQASQRELQIRMNQLQSKVSLVQKLQTDVLNTQKMPSQQELKSMSLDEIKIIQEQCATALQLESLNPTTSKRLQLLNMYINSEIEQRTSNPSNKSEGPGIRT